MRGAVAAADHPGRPLPLRVLPAPLRAALGVPRLRRARRPSCACPRLPRPSATTAAARCSSKYELVACRSDAMTLARRIAPSILAADFARLGDQVAEVVDAGADRHPRRHHGRPLRPAAVDGPAGPSARCATSAAGVEFDVHLMIERARAPRRRLRQGRRAHHHRSTPRRRRTSTTPCRQIREPGCTAGVAVMPVDAAGASSRRSDVDLGAVHDRQPGLGRPEVHRRLTGQDRAACAALAATTSSSRSTAASTIAPPVRAADAGATLFVAGSARVRGRPTRRRPSASIAAAAGV